MRLQKSPILFVQTMWELYPQEIKEEYVQTLARARETQNYDNIRLDMFEPFTNNNITWQQAEILYAVERAINGQGAKKISISSGHGIGKSTAMAILVLWFLFCFKDCKIPCTAPTQSQMYDVLWAEIQKWLLKMPQDVKDLYEYSSEYVCIKASPKTWFARAKTGRKENPEALAGLHADYMLLLVDEASGVPDAIFNSAKSALTGADTLFIMISNYTRLEGYFHASQTKFRDDFQVLSFNSEQSPIVDDSFIQEILREHGIESDEYRVRVLGKSPRVDGVDSAGWLPLISENDIRPSQIGLFGKVILGVDPAGEGKDKSLWVARDNFGAKVVAREKTSSPKSIAQITLTIMADLGIQADDIIIDSFGVGADSIQELACLGHRVNGVNVGNPSEDEEYMNLRAHYYWELRKWLKAGGLLDSSPEWLEELLTIKFKRNLRNKIQIMPKDEMRKLGHRSPNAADALMLTFKRDIPMIAKGGFKSSVVNREDDPY